MKLNIITIFPDLISQYANESILGRGQKAGVIKIKPINLRDFSEDKHKKVDDTPYGGGAGMLMKPEPLYQALKSLGALSKGKQDIPTGHPSSGTRNTHRASLCGDKKQIITNNQIPNKTNNLLMKVVDFFTNKRKKKKITVLLSPRGKQFDQKMAESFSKLDELTFICGRYEGVDQRVTDHMIDEEISIGPYVLAGGELGALIITEAVSRLVPGVLGNPESLEEETFNIKTLKHENMKTASVGDCIEYAQYTKPADFKGWKVPEVLLSGDHKKIKEWREKQ